LRKYYIVNSFKNNRARGSIVGVGQGWRTLLRARARGNFEVQNKVLESSTVIINYYIITGLVKIILTLKL
jgi:hypothetical protein